jgi:glycosyltransferase involved in cell wall biosynthesis
VPAVLGGAVEKVHLQLAKAYRAAGHDVTIISRRHGNFPHDEIVGGIRYLRIPSRDRGPSLLINLICDFFYAIRVARALPAADVTITNAFFQPLFLRRRCAGRIYVQVGRYPKGQMALYSRADRLQAVSKAVALAIARQAPWLARKTAVIGYAIPDRYFAARATRNNERVVLYVGRIAREKGIELLLQAFARLPSYLDARVLAGWRLRIVGPHAVTQGGDGEHYRAELETLARRLGVACEFTGPIFSEDALIQQYQCGAVFVYPSRAETGEALPVAPLEAMATGCAAIVSDLQCFDDYIEDGVTGLKFNHCAADPAAALAGKLARLIDDPALLAQIADSGNETAGRFSIAKIAGHMLEDFHLLLGKSQRGRQTASQ